MEIRVHVPQMHSGAPEPQCNSGPLKGAAMRGRGHCPSELCHGGLTSPVSNQHATSCTDMLRVLKRTRYLSFAPELLALLDCENFRGRGWPSRLFRSILLGIAGQGLQQRLDGDRAVCALETFRKRCCPLAVFSPGRFWDAITKDEMPADFTSETRQEEPSLCRELEVDRQGAAPG